MNRAEWTHFLACRLSGFKIKYHICRPIRVTFARLRIRGSGREFYNSHMRCYQLDTVGISTMIALKSMEVVAKSNRNIGWTTTQEDQREKRKCERAHACTKTTNKKDQEHYHRYRKSPNPLPKSILNPSAKSTKPRANHRIKKKDLTRR